MLPVHGVAHVGPPLVQGARRPWALLVRTAAAAAFPVVFVALASAVGFLLPSVPPARQDLGLFEMLPPPWPSKLGQEPFPGTVWDFALAAPPFGFRVLHVRLARCVAVPEHVRADEPLLGFVADLQFFVFPLHEYGSEINP